MNNIQQFEKYTDSEIIKKIIDGETAFFEILIRRNNPCLYKTGMSYGFTHAVTQDLMQDTFITAYLNLAKFEERATFRTWLIRIMLNNCFRRSNKLSVKNEMSNTDLINEKSIPMYSENNTADTESKIHKRELNHIIEQSLVKIPVDYRLVFCLRQLNGLDTAETAELLNISEANVKTRLNRARHLLRKEIEKKYTAEDIFEFNLVYCDAIVSNVLEKINNIIQQKNHNHANS